MKRTRKKEFFSWVLILAMVISVISPGSTALVKAEGTTDYQAKLAAVTKCLHDNVEPVYSGEWALLQQARGEDPDKKWLHSYYSSLKEQLNDKEKTAKMSNSDWVRVILAVETLGEDPTSVNGKNLFANLADFNNIDTSAWGVGTISYIMMALEGHDDSVFAVDNVAAADRTTREKLKSAIMSYYNEAEKCFNTADYYTGDPVPDSDNSAMAIQGLAAYYKTDANVKKIIDDTLTTLGEKFVDENACVMSFGWANACSTAQVICALASVGIDPTKDTRFIKNGKTLIDGLCTYFDSETGGIKTYDYYSGQEQLDLAYNTVQAGYALVAYDRLLNGKAFVFDNTDVTAPMYHVGGTATCVKKAVCEICGEEYGEVDPQNHTGNTSIKNVKAATFTEKGYSGDKVCDDCGEIIEKGKETPQKEIVDKAYALSGANAANLSVEYTGTADNEKTKVTIQNIIRDNNGVEYKVTKVADGAFANNKILTDVTIGANIVEIGVNAFKNCTKLSTVIVQNDSVTKIDEGAFSGAKALKEIDLSECRVQAIGKNVFSGCKKLKDVKLNGNNLTSVGKNAFKNIKKNAKITIYAKNKKTYKKAVKLIKKSGVKKVKYAYVKQK